MLAIKDPVLKKEIQDGIAQKKDVVHYLLKNYSVLDLAEDIADSIMNATTISPITITAEEFLAHFKIRGYKMTGEPELRGSKGLSQRDAISDLYDQLKKVQK